MSSNYLDVALITAATVGKVLLCAVVGMFVSRFFSHPKHSEKGFTYISVRVLLPLLLFSNLCLTVTWDTIKLYYWALILAFFPIIIGFAGSCLCRFFLNTTYTGMLILGCTFQNGLTFPVSVLMNLKGISWFGPEEVEIGCAHIFLYNIICSIGLWAIGEPVIKYFKGMEVQEEKKKMDEERRLLLATSRELGKNTVECDGIYVQFPYSQLYKEIEGTAPNPISAASPATAREQFSWYLPADPLDAPIRPEMLCGTSLNGKDGEASLTVSVSSSQNSNIVKNMLQAMLSPTVAGSILAIIISLVPPLRWVAETMPGQTLLGGFTLLGSGAIPIQLLVLGATVVGNKRASPNEPRAEGGKKVSRLHFLRSQQSLFVLSSIVIRLLIVPTICLGLIHVLRSLQLLPDDRVFLLAMLVGTCSPSAINSSIICVMHEYHASEYAQMIFIMYVSAIFFTTAWLFIYVLYLM